MRRLRFAMACAWIASGLWSCGHATTQLAPASRPSFSPATIDEYRYLGVGSPGLIGSDRAGNIWLAPSHNTTTSVLYLVKKEGSLVAHPLPMRMAIRSFKWADDGSLLLASYQWAVRIDAGGIAHTFGDHATPLVGDAAVDADGRPWFALPDLDAIQRFDIAGPRDVYHLGVRPESLAFDRSGELWFLYPDGIGEVTTRGQIRMHPMRAQTNMTGRLMSLSSSGVLWLAGRCGEIGRITKGHRIDFISLPEFRDCPMAIAAGPHDDAWFAEYSPSIIVHVYADGRLNFYQVPGPTTPYLSVAVDRNGHVWFSDANNRVFGELTPQDDSGRLSPPP